MNCKNCGAEIDERDSFCPYCGEKYEHIEKPNTISRTGTYDSKPAETPNATLWIILGVLSALFCCMIGGIGTTVYAAKASGNVNAGSIELASDNLKTAKQWFLATMIIAAIQYVFAFLLGVAEFI